eukprot:TRINITY_DN4130_c0_g1_i4.p1 TRINITY_DN4130_c0_g1~~TRINITY_DN4130_c0_g1_i4.p1  ORF type:complete len:206 (-),score=13.98 TRINITY_DN4130_c0_g1_i4:184-801(-)
MLLNPDTRPFKFSCVILIFQACTWFICAIYRLLRAAHSPEYTHEHSVKFVLVFGVLGLWYLINIILIVRTREALRDTTWVIQLLGLPPAFLSFAAIISVSFATMSYADNDEVTFQSLFEVASGLTLVSIASYCYTYINNGLQKSTSTSRILPLLFILLGLPLIVLFTFITNREKDALKVLEFSEKNNKMKKKCSVFGISVTQHLR